MKFSRVLFMPTSDVFETLSHLPAEAKSQSELQFAPEGKALSTVEEGLVANANNKFSIFKSTRVAFFFGFSGFVFGLASFCTDGSLYLDLFKLRLANEGLVEEREANEARILDLENQVSNLTTLDNESKDSKKIRVITPRVIKSTIIPETALAVSPQSVAGLEVLNSYKFNFLVPLDR